MHYLDIDREHLATAISIDLKMELDDAEVLAKTVTELGIMSGSITEKEAGSETSVYGILIKDRRISVNLSDIAVTALKVILGMVPLGNLTIMLETIPTIIDSIHTLTPMQQEIAGLMDAWDGRMIPIAEFRTFIAHKINESEEDINDALDDMADKNLVAIRTRVMWATW